MDVVEELNRRGGVVARAWLHEQGFTRQEMDWAVRSGRVKRIRKGWLQSGSAYGETARAVAAGGTLTCVTALRERGIWARSDTRLHVRTLRPVPPHVDFCFHRAFRGTVCGQAPFGIDSSADSIRLAVLCQPRMDAVVSLDSLANGRHLSLRELGLVLSDLPRQHRDYLDLVDEGCQSGLETKARLSLRAMRIPHRTQAWIRGVGRVDILVGDRLVLELDGRRWHSDPDSFENDRRRDLVLHEGGYLCVRISSGQVQSDWPHVLAVIRGMVVRGEHRWRARHRPLVVSVRSAEGRHVALSRGWVAATERTRT